MRKKRFLTGLCLLLALCLSGCTAGVDAINNTSSVTLPPAAVSYRAPTGDTNQETAQNVLLYVPNAAGTRLIARTERLTASAARHPAEAALSRLLAFEGSDSARPLSREARLQLSTVNPVEISGDVATVNLGTSALSLSHSELYVICQAIANTLTQWGDIRYVNVLVSSMQPGLDVGASVPAGCFAQNVNDSIDALTAAAETQAAGGRRQSLTAALYFPAYAGKGILAEAGVITLEGRDKGEMISSLLAALSRGANQLPNTPALPDLLGLMAEEPQIQEIAVTGGQCAVLRFRQRLNEALIECGVPRSVMMAALTYTITSFVPGLSGVMVYIGDEQVTAVVPNGVYEGAGETVSFAGGIMRRSDFSHFLLSNCTLYFSDGEGRLRAVERPVPYYETRSARYLLGCLMQGPQSCDSVGNVQAVLPAGIADADLLGVALDGQTILLNWGQRFAAAAEGLDEGQERLLIYAIVNTLCNLPSVRSVCFFIGGTQPETLSGALYLPGVFMRNTTLVRSE